MKRFEIRLDRELHEKLREESFITEKSMHEIVIELIENHYNKKERLGMLKEKYEIKYEELEKESQFKYFIVGSPTHLRIVKSVEGDTLKEVWGKLWEMNEIDKDKYYEENEIYNEENEEYYTEEPSDYLVAIEEYLKDSNNFYYKKCNW